LALLGMIRLVLASQPQWVTSGWALALLLVALILVFIQYRRVSSSETELYGIPKHSPIAETLFSLLVGVIGGVAGSLVLSLAGIGLVELPGTASALLFLWPVSVVLGAINPRFICFAYSATLISVVSLATGWPRVDVPSLVGLVGVIHMVEALLIWLSGASCATPMSINGQREEAVPGFRLQRYWPVPLIIPLFSISGTPPVAMPDWWPLLQPDPGLLTAGASFAWQLVPIVVTMGYSDLAIAAPPHSRVRQSARNLLIYAGVLLVLAVLATHFRPVVWVAALFCALGHEAMAVLSGRMQMLGVPYLRRPVRGVGVLDVLPGSPAALGGIKTGAVIATVDDLEVHSREDLHEALMSAQSFVRIMYRNGRQLEHCRMPRPPEGLLGLGVILLPEPGDEAMTKLGRPAFFRYSGLER